MICKDSLPLYLKGVPSMEARIIKVDAAHVAGIKAYNKKLLDRDIFKVVYLNRFKHNYRLAELDSAMFRIVETVMQTPFAVVSCNEGSENKRAYVTFVCEEQHVPLMLKLATYTRCLNIAIVHPFAVRHNPGETSDHEFSINPDERQIAYNFCSQDKSRNGQFIQLLDSALQAIAREC